MFDSYRGDKWRNIFLGVTDCFLRSKGDARLVLLSVSPRQLASRLSKSAFCYATGKRER